MRKNLVFIVIIIFILAVFVQCSREYSEPLSTEMARELALLPPSAAGLGYLNIKAVKESPFFSMVEENLEENPLYSDDYHEFMEATGLDIRKDIDELYMCVVPKEGQERPELFALIKGTYDSRKIIDYIMKNSDEDEIISKSYAQQTIYQLEDEKFSICFADDNRLVLGNEDQIKFWLDNYREQKEHRMANDLQRRIEDVRYKGGAWMSINAKGFIDGMMNEIDHHTRKGRFEALKSLQNMNASIKFDEKLTFHGMSQFSDKEKAQLFHDALKGFIATAKLSMSKDRKAVDVLNKIQTDIKGKKIIIEFEMSKEDIDRLKKGNKQLALM